MSVNKVILVGNLGKDPEVSYTQTGTAVAKFSLATTEKWNDKATGEKKEKTDWHRLTCFGKKAELIGEWVKKGQQLYVDGRIQYGSYDKSGQTIYTTDIIINDFQMLGGRTTKQANERTTEQANDDVAF